MTPVLEVLAIGAGSLIVAATLWSAMVTVVVPRSERPLITRVHFRFSMGLTHAIAQRYGDPVRSDRLQSRLAPFALVTLPFVWAGHVTVGFALIFRGLGTPSVLDALVLSGSSLTTLGIRDAADTPTLLLVVLEALVGLGLVALMISYLPTIYGAYTDREIAVARLEVRAGRPPHPVTFLERTNNIGWLGQMDLVWAEWEHWFLQIEETHTTHASLSHFRSAYPGRSWLTAAGTVLDTAALLLSTVEVEASPRAALCLRSGFTTLSSIADAFDLEHPHDPHWPDHAISLDRADFDALCDALRSRSIPLRDDLDEAWEGFAGWRVNYDAALYRLFGDLRIDPGPWFGGREVDPADLAGRRARPASRRSSRSRHPKTNPS